MKQGFIHFFSLQESDDEKDKDEAGAPGSVKAKKKKKKKKKVEDAGPSAPVRIFPEIIHEGLNCYFKPNAENLYHIQSQMKAERDTSVATPAQSVTGNVSAATAGVRTLCFSTFIWILATKTCS